MNNYNFNTVNNGWLPLIDITPQDDESSVDPVGKNHCKLQTSWFYYNNIILWTANDQPFFEEFIAAAQSSDQADDEMEEDDEEEEDDGEDDEEEEDEEEEEEEEEDEEEDTKFFIEIILPLFISLLHFYGLESLIVQAPSATTISAVLPQPQECDLEERRKVEQFAVSGCCCSKGPNNTPCWKKIAIEQ